MRCTGRLLIEDRANVRDGGRGRATSCGGRHTAIFERLECSVRCACVSTNARCKPRIRAKKFAKPCGEKFLEPNDANGT